MIEFDNVSKKYDQKIVLAPFSLKIPEGRSLAILGPNGAGKTTLIRMALGVIPPTKGSVRIWGQSATEASFTLKRRIGVVLEEQNFMLHVTAQQYLQFFGELYEVENSSSRIHELMRFMELEGVLDKKISTFSTGMKRKLNIIQAVLHSPDVLFVDELFSGLDPIGITLTMQLLRELKAHGTTLILSSHILSDLDELVDDVLILNEGNLVVAGTKEALWLELGMLSVGKVEVGESQKSLFINILKSLDVKQIQEELNGIVEFLVPNKISNFKQSLATLILENKVQMMSISYTKPRLQQLYAQVLGWEKTGNHAL